MTDAELYNCFKARESYALALMYLREVLLDDKNLGIDASDERYEKCKLVLNKMGDGLKLLADQIEPINGSPLLWPDEEVA